MSHHHFFRELSGLRACQARGPVAIQKVPFQKHKARQMSVAISSCPKCGSNIPEPNLELHQLRCNGNRPSQASYPAPDRAHAREVVREQPVAYPRVPPQFAVETIRPGGTSPPPERNTARPARPSQPQPPQTQPRPPAPQDEMDEDLARAIELSLRESQQASRQQPRQGGDTDGRAPVPGPWRCRACGAPNADPYELTCEMCNTRRPPVGSDEPLEPQDDQDDQSSLRKFICMNLPCISGHSVVRRRCSVSSARAAGDGRGGVRQKCCWAALLLAQRCRRWAPSPATAGDILHHTDSRMLVATPPPPRHASTFARWSTAGTRPRSLLVARVAALARRCRPPPKALCRYPAPPPSRPAPSRPAPPLDSVERGETSGEKRRRGKPGGAGCVGGWGAGRRRPPVDPSCP